MYKRMWNGILLASFLALLLGVPRANAAEKRDQKAVEIAHTMMQAMGGQVAWKAAHYIRFDFKVMKGGKTLVDRHYLWDKYKERFRLETKTKDGRQEVALVNPSPVPGHVYIDGKVLTGQAAAKALKAAYAAHINDMYWLAAPWKWLDPGVNLHYVGARRHAGQICDVVKLTFNHVGLTPGDTYWEYVSRKSHLMIYWTYHLQSGQRGSWNWEYGHYDGILLAKDHVSADKKTEISMGKVEVLKSVNDAYFTDPSHMLSGLK